MLAKKKYYSWGDQLVFNMNVNIELNICIFNLNLDDILIFIFQLDFSSATRHMRTF